MSYDPDTDVGLAARPPGLTIPYIQMPYADGDTRAPRIYWYTGSPETVVTGRIGDMFLRTDGGAGTTLYIKETGADTNTGWAAK